MGKKSEQIDQLLDIGSRMAQELVEIAEALEEHGEKTKATHELLDEWEEIRKPIEGL
ncbi:hypothetical protein [Solemya pervernicosa gill symbiont]|uniref:hypothetical protein n=1 Tax=Solemya pervernicosa gill symbiont TaxID=642797 RepID=UPI00155FE88A|nr:hypothetical protein [Solemya pervernicosa gill symbiont]